MTHKKQLPVTLLAVLGLGIAGCASFINGFSMYHAIDKDGRLFLAILNTSTQALNKEGRAVRAIVIGGVNYPYSMIKMAPFGKAKDAVLAGIHPNAPGGWTLYIPGKYLIYPKRPGVYPAEISFHAAGNAAKAPADTAG
jgi:hypothetical protein